MIGILKWEIEGEAVVSCCYGKGGGRETASISLHSAAWLLYWRHALYDFPIPRPTMSHTRQYLQKFRNKFVYSEYSRGLFTDFFLRKSRYSDQGVSFPQPHLMLVSHLAYYRFCQVLVPLLLILNACPKTVNYVQQKAGSQKIVNSRWIRRKKEIYVSL